jgi:hypothetical protein
LISFSYKMFPKNVCNNYDPDIFSLLIIDSEDRKYNIMMNFATKIS